MTPEQIDERLKIIRDDYAVNYWEYMEFGKCKDPNFEQTFNDAIKKLFKESLPSELPWRDLKNTYRNDLLSIIKKQWQ
jgi:hypothetical protein